MYMYGYLVHLFADDWPSSKRTSMRDRESNEAYCNIEEKRGREKVMKRQRSHHTGDEDEKKIGKGRKQEKTRTFLQYSTRNKTLSQYYLYLLPSVVTQFFLWNDDDDDREVKTVFIYIFIVNVLRRYRLRFLCFLFSLTVWLYILQLLITATNFNEIQHAAF